jgi:hypothetical protein
MPQDHYVAQTYLRAFGDPATVKDPEKGGLLHAWRKSDLGYFPAYANNICKTAGWDDNPTYLRPPDALGQWLKIVEPHWKLSVGKLSSSTLAPVDKLMIAGYWAYLCVCTPTWQRVATKLQQTDLEENRLPQFIEYATSHPDEFPKAPEYLALLHGKVAIEIDSNYPKAVLTKGLHRVQWRLYHQEWNVIYNETEELFLTSDNPSCFDYRYGSAVDPARYLPLTPRLALWTNGQAKNIPPQKAGEILPANGSSGRQATAKFVREMNTLVIQSAENIVLSSAQRPYILPCVTKYRNWWVSAAQTINIPDADGYYEVVQTRARPKNAGERGRPGSSAVSQIPIRSTLSRLTSSLRRS